MSPKEKLYNAVIETTGLLYTIKFSDESEQLFGKVKLHYEKGIVKITGARNFTMSIKDMINPVITLRRDFSFSYQGIYYYIHLNKFGASLLRIAQDKY